MPSLSLSERGRNTPESPIRKLAPFAEKAKTNGKKIYHLNIGQPDIPTPREFYQAVKSFDERVLSYGPSNGLPFFRDQLKSYYRRNGIETIQDGHIMVTTAGSEAVFFSIMAVASPGEEIIVLEPFYPNYNGFCHMAGVRLVPVQTESETGYHLPPVEKIEAKISSRTKAILICTPNNPTGTVLTREEMEALKNIAIKNDLFILSDEVYREFTFEGKHTSLLDFDELEQHAVVTDSLSKRYSACGARVGCIVSRNTGFMETVLKFGQARLCPPTLEQVAASSMVQKGDVYFSDMIKEYKLRRDVIYGELTSIPGIRCKKPEGAFYLMVTFPVENIEEFAKWLLTDFDVQGETTMMAPGPGFYATPGKGMQEARIAYVLNSDDLKRAVNVLREGLKTYTTV